MKKVLYDARCFFLSVLCDKWSFHFTSAFLKFRYKSRS
jgi:hypothetical protein